MHPTSDLALVALLVDGHLRTVVARNHWSTEVNQTICSVAEAVGGDMKLGTHCSDLQTNPVVAFDAVSLPSGRLVVNASSAGTLVPMAFPADAALLGSDVRSSELLCSSVPQASLANGPVFAVAGGTFYVADPRQELVENSLDSPANNVNLNKQDRLDGKCPTAPKTFVNEHSCVTGVETCQSTTITSAKFTLNASIIELFNTGPQGLNVHYVTGLTAESGPCSGVSSRWIRLDAGTTCDSQLDAETHDVIADQLVRRSDWQIRDVVIEGGACAAPPGTTVKIQSGVVHVAATSFSNPIGTDTSHPQYSASMCIDNNPSSGMCHSNKVTDGWLKLDLGVRQAVSGVQIYNRVDCCQGRLGAHVIETSDDDATWATCFAGTLPSTYGPHFEACAATARYVRVRLDGHADYINLAEVQVIGSGGDEDACWQHVQRHERGVYDFSYWNIHRPAATAARLQGSPNPPFPSDLLTDGGAGLVWNGSMAEWDQIVRSGTPTFMGRLGDEVDFKDLPSSVQAAVAVAEAVGAQTIASFTNVETCGSAGEVTNVPSHGIQYSLGRYVLPQERRALGSPPVGSPVAATPLDRAVSGHVDTRTEVWGNVALKAPDQLRQRMAWALTNICGHCRWSGALLLS